MRHCLKTVPLYGNIVHHAVIQRTEHSDPMQVHNLFRNLMNSEINIQGLSIQKNISSIQPRYGCIKPGRNVSDSEKFTVSINQGLRSAFKKYKHSEYNQESFAI